MKANASSPAGRGAAGSAAAGQASSTGPAHPPHVIGPLPLSVVTAPTDLSIPTVAVAGARNQHSLPAPLGSGNQGRISIAQTLPAGFSLSQQRSDAGPAPVEHDGIQAMQTQDFSDDVSNSSKTMKTPTNDRIPG